MSRVTLLALVLAGSLAPAACVSGKPDIDEDFSDLAAVDQKSDYFSYRLKLLGALDDGVSHTTRYTKSPRFRGWDFHAATGDHVDVWVRSTRGDALTWVLDSAFKVIAKNDDADDTTYDSHLDVTLPASADGHYYVVFRDYSMESHDFTATFAHTGGASAPDAAWEAAAEQQLGDMIENDSTLRDLTIAESALPAAGKARYDASAAVLERPTCYRVDVQGRPVYLVLATDGSGEGGTVVADLIDGAGRWFAHGAGHAVWDGGSMGWGNDPADPTMCHCEGTSSTCTWMDGTSGPGDLSCE